MEDITALKKDSPLKSMLSAEKMILLKKRGFYVPSSFEIDDHFFKNEYDRERFSFLRSRLTINELINMSCEDLEEELFKKDSVYAQEVSFSFRMNRFYDFLGMDKLFFDVTPDCLDPFIAGYVRAINRCGIRTFFSCDGWHRMRGQSKKVVIFFDERYSCIWHKILCEHVYLPDGIRWEHYYDGSEGSATIDLPDDDDGKKAIYERILLLAEEFNKNMRFFQTLKICLVSQIDRFEIDFMTGSEVEQCFQSVVSKIFSKLDGFELQNR